MARKGRSIQPPLTYDDDSATILIAGDAVVEQPAQMLSAPVAVCGQSTITFGNSRFLARWMVIAT
jgi:hypothetical protein